MNFGEALEHLKNGTHVARAGWNGKGMWLALVVHGAGSNSASGIGYVLHFDAYRAPQLRSRLSFLDPPEPLPFIVMKTADNKFVPWLASQTDVLANDWSIVE